MWDVGASGYCQWQVTEDKGSDVNWQEGARDRVFAAGPEIGVFIPAAKLMASLRHLWEFQARSRPQGMITTLTLTKIF